MITVVLYFFKYCLFYFVCFSTLDEARWWSLGPPLRPGDGAESARLHDASAAAAPARDPPLIPAA